MKTSLSLPPHPPPAPRSPFPVAASVAPMAAAGVIWAITRSPFALVFAALSPVVAIASMVDSRWQTRRRRRREEAERRDTLDTLRRRIAARHEEERAHRLRRYPPATAILRAAEGDVTRWRRGAGASRRLTVVLGVGAVASGIELEGAARSEVESALVARAAVLEDAVVTVDAGVGIGIVGPPAQARAIARGYLVQLAHLLSPVHAELGVVPPDCWEWAAALPHAAVPPARVPPSGASQLDETRIEIIESYSGAGRVGTRQAHDGALVTIALADAAERLPPSCRTVITVVGADTAHIVSSVEGGPRGVIATELVSTAQARNYAGVLRRHADAAGIGTGRVLPSTARFAELSQPHHVEAGTLACSIGLDDEGLHVLDLVTQGPHAIVGGTTGSGKSELLITWVTAMAAVHSPHEVAFLLVDFKGGAAFAPLTVLPHCVGVMTDLDHAAAARALVSLGAELRYRERTLAEWGASDIAHPSCRNRLARLVIVVDEFAAMLDALPELHAVLTDVAARGRSLGVHLILCTQRPAGAVRDSLLANCGLRLSLRVNNRADSQAVVGTDAAAALSTMTPGRCIVAAGAAPRTVQVATTGLADISRVARASEARDRASSVRRPWLEPLPGDVPLSSLAAPAPDELVLGVEDVPEEQRQTVISYRPRRDGGLLALGARRSGRSTLLACLAAQTAWTGEVVLCGASDERCWDALCEASERARGRADADPWPEDRLLAIDDIDALWARLPVEYQQEFVDMVGVLLRDGPAVGVWLAATAQRLQGPLAALASLFGTQLVLRMPNRQEHLLAGADAVLFDERLGPGGASWRGHRVQLADPTESLPPPVSPTRPSAAESAPPLRIEPGADYVVVSRAPGRRAAELRQALGDRARVAQIGPGTRVEDRRSVAVAAGAPASVLVGDPDAWQAQWALLGTLRPCATLVFDGCSPAEVRAIAHTRSLPPLLAPGRDHVWICDEEGMLKRARLPSPQ